MKLCAVGAKLFHTDGKTDRHAKVVTFCNFANMPKDTKQSSKTALTRKTDQHTVIKTYTTKSIT